jgi:hypothetical protein
MNAIAHVTFDVAALAEPKLRIVIQQSPTMAPGSWTALATRQNGVWTGSAPLTTPDGPILHHTFTTPAKPDTTPRWFVRLLVEELP